MEQAAPIRAAQKWSVSRHARRQHTSDTAREDASVSLPHPDLEVLPEGTTHKDFLEAGSPCAHHRLHPLSHERERRAHLITDLAQRLIGRSRNFFFRLPSEDYKV